MPVPHDDNLLAPESPLETLEFKKKMECEGSSSPETTQHSLDDQHVPE
jgi:hypothetical protein